jgi:hypothetical protein
MLPSRKGLGKRILSYVALLGGAGLMLLASVLWNFVMRLPFIGNPALAGDTSLVWGALAFLCYGFRERRRREAEIKAGILVDEAGTVSVGKGYFRYLPIPEHLIGFVDPLVCLLIFAVVYYRLHIVLLGLWGIVASVAFFVCELRVHNRCEEELCDRIDAGLLGRVSAAVMSQVEQARKNGEDSEETKNTSSIATGTDDLLQAEIERRNQTR